MKLCPSFWLASLAAFATLVSSHAHAQQTIKVDGSTGVAPLVAALAKAYQTKQPGAVIEIGKGLGTKARIEALAAGMIDVAMASHGLAIDDLRRGGMVVHEIARTPVVFGVHGGVDVVGLSEAQVCTIYSGERTNWKDLGGPDLVIAPRTRPESEVDTEVARDGVACLKGMKMTDTVKVMPRSGDMAAELAATPGALGMTTSTVVEQSGGKIRAIALNGVVADEANVRSGRYKLVRPAYLVTRSDTTPMAAAFIVFVNSPEGAAVIKANGGIPTAK